MSKIQIEPEADAIGPEQTYFRYLEKGDWRVPRCQGCHTVVFYPRVACTTCGTSTFDWIAPSGLGVIYSTTTMRRTEHAGGDRNLCLVDLDEGFRMMSCIEVGNNGVPNIGDRVEARLRKEAENNLVVFTLTESVA